MTLVPGDSLKHPKDVLGLDLPKRAERRSGGGAQGGLNREGELEDLPLAQDDGTGEDVFQLPHVSPPIVGNELTHHLR